MRTGESLPEASAEQLPKQVGWFTLTQEPTSGYRWASAMMAPLLFRLIPLREGHVDIDAARVRILMFDLISTLADNQATSAKALVYWHRLCHNHPESTTFLFSEDDGIVELFEKASD